MRVVRQGFSDLVIAFKDAGCDVDEMMFSDFHYWESNVSQYALGKYGLQDRPYLSPMCWVKFQKDKNTKEVTMYFKNDFSDKTF